MKEEKKKDEKFHYQNRTMRLADLTWERFKAARRKSAKSWNLFIVDVLEGLKHYGKGKNH
jgi:hypothetical protein